MMNHDEVGRGDFVLLDEISPQSFIHNLRIRLVNLYSTITKLVQINVSNAQGGTDRKGSDSAGGWAKGSSNCHPYSS